MLCNLKQKKKEKKAFEFLVKESCCFYFIFSLIDLIGLCEEKEKKKENLFDFPQTIVK